MSLRRVLVVQPYGIGDLLFLTPVFRALRLLPGIEKVDLLLGSRTEEVVRNNPHIDEIIPVDKDLFHRQGRWKTFGDAIRLGKRLRENRYDLLLDYSIRGEYGFFAAFFLGIRKRAGFFYKRRGLFHDIRLPIPDGFKGRHVADYCSDLAEAAGVPVKNRWLEFYLTAAERTGIDGRLETLIPKDWKDRYVVISPGGGESWGKDAHFKRWPPESFAAFAGALVKRFGLAGAAVIGSGRETALAETLLRSMDSKGVNLAGRLTLRETVRVIERSALFTGNDGGLLHLACARRKPVIGFYGPVDPAVYGPYPESGFSAAVYKNGLECRPCYGRFRYKSDCAHRNCLAALGAGEAMTFLESLPGWPGIVSRVNGGAETP